MKKKIKKQERASNMEDYKENNNMNDTENTKQENWYENFFLNY